MSKTAMPAVSMLFNCVKNPYINTSPLEGEPWEFTSGNILPININSVLGFAVFILLMQDCILALNAVLEVVPQISFIPMSKITKSGTLGTTILSQYWSIHDTILPPHEPLIMVISEPNLASNAFSNKST